MRKTLLIINLIIKALVELTAFVLIILPILIIFLLGTTLYHYISKTVNDYIDTIEAN